MLLNYKKKRMPNWLNYIIKSKRKNFNNKNENLNNSNWKNWKTISNNRGKRA